MELTGYGRSTGFCVDPIEKKPLNHFLPGSSVLSFGTAGCNLACAFCQNWDISKSREVARLSAQAMPETIARAAERLGLRQRRLHLQRPGHLHGICARHGGSLPGEGDQECRRHRGLRLRGAAQALLRRPWTPRTSISRRSPSASTRSAAPARSRRCSIRSNISFARRKCGLRSRRCSFPARTISDEEIEAMTKWVAQELKRDMPLHFTAFHPDYRMLETPPTPFGDAAAGARDRNQEWPSSRLCRQCPRSGARGDAVPDLRGALRSGATATGSRVRARRVRRLLKLRHEDGGRIRREARPMGLAAAAGRYRALRRLRARVAAHVSDSSI